jgi:hypothetical protein
MVPVGGSGGFRENSAITERLYAITGPRELFEGLSSRTRELPLGDWLVCRFSSGHGGRYAGRAGAVLSYWDE